MTAVYRNGWQAALQFIGLCWGRAGAVLTAYGNGWQTVLQFIGLCRGLCWSSSQANSPHRLWKWLANSPPHLWNCLGNCVLLLGNCVLLLGQLCLTTWATVSYYLWKCLTNSPPIYRTVLGTVLEQFSGKQSSPFMELFGQLCLTVWATLSYCLGNSVLLFGQLCLTVWATLSYCLWKWLARSFPIYGNGFRSCTSENQRLHKELSNSKNRVTYRVR